MREHFVTETIRAATGRMEALHAVAAFALPDAWVAAGAIRNAIWDRLHDYVTWTPLADIDVVWFDRARADAAIDAALERRLGALMPEYCWSVENQARMHVRNGDAPYSSATDAMRFWPETATAVGARLTEGTGIDLTAPYGLEDLVNLVVRPARTWAPRRLQAYHARVRNKQWKKHWLRLTVLFTP